MEDNQKSGQSFAIATHPWVLPILNSHLPISQIPFESKRQKKPPPKSEGGHQDSKKINLKT
jgi:hypothetical protein